MTDPRRTPANARVAAMELRGQCQSPRFTEGTAQSVTAALVDLRRAPNGPRDRQLRMGARVRSFEDLDGWSFVQSLEDGYVGYVPTSALGPLADPTHRIAVRASHVYDGPKVQAPDLGSLSFDARVAVTDRDNGFAKTPAGWVPDAHLRPLDAAWTDPVDVAELLLGTPYLWGGNGAGGIDCSGLVQLSCQACGIACPGDADMQEAELGTLLPPDAPLQRGDVMFWKGHVAWVSDPATILHANGHTMSVAYEPMQDAIARIAGHEFGAVTSRRRVT